MTTVKVQKNQIIAKQKEKVKKWYIVQEGTVIQCNSYAKIVLGKNAVIGISEGDRYLCDYVATEDSVLAVFNCESAEDLKEVFTGRRACAVFCFGQHSDSGRCFLEPMPVLPIW